MKKITSITTIITSALLPVAAKAQVINESQIPEVVKGPSLPELINNVMGILFFVVGVASVIVIVVAGLMYVVSAGNEKTTKQAKDAILYAAIGIVVSLSAYAITNFLNTRLN